MSFDIEIKKLNKEQLDAVNTIFGPVMVVAGPGTGKTQMLAIRIANILKQTDYSPENILCLTFTESGAKAMRERLFKFIGKESYYVSVSTFHSFTNEIIQSHPEHFAFAKDLLQLDDLNRLKIIQEIIDADEKLDQLRPFHNRYAKEPLIRQTIQNLKKDGITPDELEIRVTNLKKYHQENVNLNRTGKPTKDWTDKTKKIEQLEEFVRVYKSYQAKLKESGYYDYEDMIMFVNTKFQNDKNFLEDYQIKYQFILVDEYQDTNGSQNELINLLSDVENPNIFVVGDDDQSIYRFQGANVGNILNFNKHFPNAKIIVTKTNYRSSQIILDSSASVIENNFTRLTKYIPNLDKNLSADKKSITNQIQHIEFETQDEENIFIAKEIEQLCKSGANYSDIAVIFRKNRHAEDISQTLNKFNIPTQISISESVFDNQRVTELIKILQGINLYGTSEDVFLYEIMTLPYFEIDIVNLYKLLKYAKKQRFSLADILIMQDESVLKDGFELSVDIQNFANKLKDWHLQSKRLPASEFILNLVNEIGFIKNLLQVDANPDNDTAEESSKLVDILSVKSFVEFIAMQEKINPANTLVTILEDVNTATENGINISVPTANVKEDSVQLVTAHSSKGLEYEYVFIAKATDNNWGVKRQSSKILVPDIFVDDASAFENVSGKELEMEDERRLFYVAMTRAKQKLYITNADQYPSGNSFTSSVSSLFVNEIDSKFVEASRITKDTNTDIQNYVTLLQPNKIINFKQKERNYLLEQVNNFKLSASALNSYINSPQEFFKNYIISVPQIQNHFTALGTAIHYALNKLNFAFLNQKIKVSSDFSLSELVNSFEYKLKQDFASNEKFDDTLKEGVSILTDYYQEYIASNLYKEPCESEFSFKNVYLEIPDSSPIELTGRIDKIEKINSEGDVRIVDFKTKSPISDNEIKGLTKSSNGDYWRQLVFYKLLVEQANSFGPIRNNKLNSKYNAVDFEIDFLKPRANGKFAKANFQVTASDIIDLKNLIVRVVKNIRNLKFPEKFDL